LLKQQVKLSEPTQSISTGNGSDFDKELDSLAAKRLTGDPQARIRLITQLHNMYAGALQKEFLVIHSPGGWGNSPWEEVQDWEKSIVTGVTSTLLNIGHNYYVTQYLRGGKTKGHFLDILRDVRFFNSGVSHRAEVLAEGLKLITKYLPEKNIILVGASQGAAFDNATMQDLGHLSHVYSIELGTFFPYMKRRKLTERTLAIDSNGLMRDPICNRDLLAGLRAYMGAFGRWSKLRAMGKRVKFTRCINTPGHEYRWEFPAVHTNITKFLVEKFATKQ
jgi:hypothetical protein